MRILLLFINILMINIGMAQTNSCAEDLGGVRDLYDYGNKLSNTVSAEHVLCSNSVTSQNKASSLFGQYGIVGAGYSLTNWSNESKSDCEIIKNFQKTDQKTSLRISKINTAATDAWIRCLKIKERGFHAWAEIDKTNPFIFNLYANYIPFDLNKNKAENIDILIDSSMSVTCDPNISSIDEVGPKGFIVPGKTGSPDKEVHLICKRPKSDGFTINIKNDVKDRKIIIDEVPPFRCVKTYNTNVALECSGSSSSCNRNTHCVKLDDVKKDPGFSNAKYLRIDDTSITKILKNNIGSTNIHYSQNNKYDSFCWYLEGSVHGAIADIAMEVVIEEPRINSSSKPTICTDSR